MTYTDFIGDEYIQRCVDCRSTYVFVEVDYHKKQSEFFCQKCYDCRAHYGKIPYIDEEEQDFGGEVREFLDVEQIKIIK